MKLFYSFTFLFTILTFNNYLYDDVSSSSGNIRFDSNNDGVEEMVLNSNGLGIGAASPSSNLHVTGNAIIQGDLAIGTTSSNSTLHINGTIGFSTTTITGNTQLGSAASYILADTSSNNILVTLPYASNVTGRSYTIKKISNNNSLLISGGGNSIDSKAGLEFTSSNNILPYVRVMSDGSAWYITNILSNSISEVASANLVAYFNFNESSGNTVNDSSGNTNLNTSYLLSGMTFSDNGIINGKYDRALNFQGSGLSLTNEITFTDEFTISLWWNISHDTNHRMAISGPSLAKIGHNNDGTNFFFRPVASSADTSATLPSANQWHFIAFTRDSLGKIDLYVDSSTPQRLFSDVAQTGNSTWDSIGFATPGVIQTISGNLDDIRFYNKKLSQDEIKILLNE